MAIPVMQRVSLLSILLHEVQRDFDAKTAYYTNDFAKPKTGQTALTTVLDHFATLLTRGTVKESNRIIAVLSGSLKAEGAMEVGVVRSVSWVVL